MSAKTAKMKRQHSPQENRMEYTYMLKVAVGLVLLKLNEPSIAVLDGIAPLDAPILLHEVIDFRAVNLGSIVALDVKDTCAC